MAIFHRIAATAISLLIAISVSSSSTTVVFGQENNQLTISEFMASNGATLLDEDGDFSDWIEIHNMGSTTVDLQGYSLTDDNGELDQWVFPSTNLAAGEYLVVFASSKDRAISGNQLHTNFKLSAGGEYVALIDEAGAILSEYAPEYPPQFSDISFGFANDGSGEYYESPTPGASNGAGVFPYLPPIEKPTSSLARGFYTGSQTAILSASTDATIRYTTDGSTPTETSGTEYSVPLTIDQTTTLRAISVVEGEGVSKAATFTYIFLENVLDQATPTGWPTGIVNEQVLDYEMDPEIVTGQREAVKQSLASLPSLSIVTDLDNLLDPTTGIYVNAEERGRTWERPTSLELLNPDNSPAFQIDAGIRTRGGFSRRGENPKHSLRFYFRSEYGGTLEYPLFEDEGVTSFKRLGLRTAQNNSWSFQGDGKNTFLRDIWQRDTQRTMGSPYTRSRYVHLYINGSYWGVYMTQERAREEYAESYFGGTEDDYDVIKADSNNNSKYEVSGGNDEGWLTLWDLTQDQVVTDAEYAQIADAVDLDNLIDSQLIRFHAGDYDGVISGYEDNLRANNWIAMRNRVGDSPKWIFIVHDGEASMGVVQRDVFIDRVGPFPTLVGNEFYQADYFNPSWLHQALVSNNQYRDRFKARVALHIQTPGGALTRAESLARWNVREAQVASAILAESARWGDAKREPAYEVADWEREVNFVENVWFAERSETVLAQLVALDLAADPSANTVPIANAGEDQTAVDSDNSGGENITLNGSGSNDSDGSITTYEWSSDSGVTIPNGSNPTALFPVGAHNVTLTVTDNDGAFASDAVVIIVEAAPLEMLGDVNCDNEIDSIDALFVLQYTVNLRSDSGGCPLANEGTLYVNAGDVDGSGVIDVVDSLFLLQCTVGISNTFCPEVRAAAVMTAKETAIAEKVKQILINKGLWIEKDPAIFIPLISNAQ